MEDKDIKKMCEDHWSYVEKIIRNEYDSEISIPDSGIDIDAYCRRVGLHYKTAMEHGFKHGVEYENNPLNHCHKDFLKNSNVGE